MTLTVELWQFLSALTVVCAGVAWLVTLQQWQRAHERECALRYTQIEKMMSTMNETLTHIREQVIELHRRHPNSPILLDRLQALIVELQEARRP